MEYDIPQVSPYVGKEEKENLNEVIERKWLTRGSFSKKFSDLIKEKTGAKFVILTNNGTVALYLSLKAIGVESKEVIVPDFTFNASAESVIFAEGEPRFVDVNYDDFNLDPQRVKEAITPDTKVIMPVHIYGQSANMEPIIDLAEQYGLSVLEDSAECFGVHYKNQHAGTIGDIGIFSFYADKTIITGEGAAIVTDSPDLKERLELLQNHGRSDSGTFTHKELGMNFRISDLQSAVGVAQIEKLSEIKRLKLEHYYQYREELADVQEIEFMKENSFSDIIPFRVAIKSEDKKRLMIFLEEKGIETRGFFFPLHRQPCFSFLKYDKEDFPVSNRLFNEGINLPVFPKLTEKQIHHICISIKGFYGI